MTKNFLCDVGTCGQFHRHFTHITYGRSKISLCILKTLCRSMPAVVGPAYFAKAVSYVCKMFMKLIKGAKVTQNVFVITEGMAK